ncbi:(E)-4-hydroxy-3-methylbut-2-enyl-diphosphate synthase (flavodoxin) [hydrothermal vent metagenome]|uniref:(E)-4-hydroxy-3-methylbut-2-enyl-diphosphate synthase (Flavodoxin) n=1 Tax=hydrothermal vent metagenome TaxID=652676 RepID=A0A3B1BXW4_9ZZZZ
MRKTRQIAVGGVKIGNGAFVSVQSMTNTDTRDVNATVAQIKRLEAVECEIVRVAVPDETAASAISEIRRQIKIPLIADIHFDYRLALTALDCGADGLRINPGNIGAKWKVEEVVKAAKAKNAPIRIGVNAGSLKRELLQKYGGPTAEAMVDSAMENIEILENLNFPNIKVSLKASSVRTTVDAYRLLADRVDYPFHIGVSEAGTRWGGTIKSAIGIGALLLDGIGDTLRVSLTDDPVEEVRVGYEILKSVGIRKTSPDLVSCPTCGRCEINLVKLAQEVEARLCEMKKPITVAVMGCIVNGPGEAREADVGIAGGANGEGLIFRKGKIIRKVPESKLRDALFEEINKL